MVHISSTENATTENATTTSCLDIKNAISNAIETEYFNLEDSQLLKLIYHFRIDGKNAIIQSYDKNDNYLGPQLAHATYHGCGVELVEEILDSVSNKYISLNHTLYLNDDNNLVVDLRDPKTLNLIRTINARKLLKQPTLKSELEDEGSLKHGDKCVWDPKVPRAGCGTDKVGTQLQCIYPDPRATQDNTYPEPEFKGDKNRMQYVTNRDGARNGICQCPLMYVTDQTGPGGDDQVLGTWWGNQYGEVKNKDKVCSNDMGEDRVHHDWENYPTHDKAGKCPDVWWDAGTGPAPYGTIDPATGQPRNLLTCNGTTPGVCVQKYSRTGQSHGGTCGEIHSSSELWWKWFSGANGSWKVYCERGGCGSDHRGTKYRCIPDSSDPKQSKKGKCSCPAGCSWHNPKSAVKPYCRKNGTKSTKCDKQPEADPALSDNKPITPIR